MGVWIVPLYAALLTFLYIGLSFRVIRYRRGHRISLGDGDDAEMQRRMRVHANFAEYAPLTLLLLLMAELGGVAGWLLHPLGAMLLAGRALHAWGVSREPQDFRGRVGGMVLTFLAMGGAALLCLGLMLLSPPTV